VFSVVVRLFFICGVKVYYFNLQFRILLCRWRLLCACDEIATRAGSILTSDALWAGGPAKCVLCRLGRCAPKEADLPIYSGENVSGLVGEAIMLCMEPLCVRMMQLASFTFSFI
jgi:hypothetical protein